MAARQSSGARKVIGINMKAQVTDELIARAESMHLSVSKYCQLILVQHLESGKKLKLQEG